MLNIYAYKKIFMCYEMHMKFSEKINGILSIGEDGNIYLVEDDKEPWLILLDMSDHFMSTWCDNCWCADECPVKITKRWDNFGELPKSLTEEDIGEFLSLLDEL